MTLRHRLSACAVLAVFLAAQAWLVCPVMCLTDAAGSAPSGQRAMAVMRMTGGDAYCHPKSGLSAGVPAVLQQLSPMLTARAPIALAGGRQVSSRPFIIRPQLSRTIPPADPPPPRPV